MGSLVVILVYAATLWLILFPPRALEEAEPERASWWKNVRFWASLIVVAQIAVYALWG